jgi:hypothetical protein
MNQSVESARPRSLWRLDLCCPPSSSRSRCLIYLRREYSYQPRLDLWLDRHGRMWDLHHCRGGESLRRGRA